MMYQERSKQDVTKAAFQQLQHCELTYSQQEFCSHSRTHHSGMLLEGDSGKHSKAKHSDSRDARTRPPSPPQGAGRAAKRGSLSSLMLVPDIKVRVTDHYFDLDPSNEDRALVLCHHVVKVQPVGPSATTLAMRSFLLPQYGNPYPAFLGAYFPLTDASTKWGSSMCDFLHFQESCHIPFTTFWLTP